MSTPKAKGAAAASTPGSGWTGAQEKALKTAVAKTSEQTPNRWAKVAEAVGGGKTKDACKKHFKEIGK